MFCGAQFSFEPHVSLDTDAKQSQPSLHFVRLVVEQAEQQQILQQVVRQVHRRSEAYKSFCTARCTICSPTNRQRIEVVGFGLIGNEMLANFCLHFFVSFSYTFRVIVVLFISIKPPLLTEGLVLRWKLNPGEE